MRFATVADFKNKLSEYLARATRDREPILVTRHGRPYALVQPLSEGDLEELGWKEAGQSSLEKAWEGESDEFYDYL